jgi:hypothetical protein
VPAASGGHCRLVVTRRKRKKEKHMPYETTEIRLGARGDETHESWLLVRANTVSSNPGRRLFDSEIPHQHFIQVSITRCTRRRDLSRDWLHNDKVLLKMDMSQAQWGAFVSSFGDGPGVPATLSYLNGYVPQAPAESRFDQSHAEVLASGTRALANVKQSYTDVMAAFESGGKKALREALLTLGHRIDNAPTNMEFAASSLTEHVEQVVTKARADIEGMVLAAMKRGELVESTAMFEIEAEARETN